MAIPELGAKQICPTCQAKFYDLNKRPAVCPKCSAEFDPDEAVRTRRTRVRAIPPEAEAEEEREDQVRAREPDEEEEEEEATPEIDEAANDVPLVADDEDGEPAVVEDDALPGFSDEEELEDEDDADVPFLEDEDDEFDDSEIDGLPDGEEER